jgi:tetratricopeptide (TPR) repeat protein/pimeloyl-ACP methyl ester carboxylesterase
MFSNPSQRYSLQGIRFLFFATLLLFLGCATSKPQLVGPSRSSLHFEKSRPDKLIVFVHGLEGDSVETWTRKNGAGAFFWPQGLFEDSSFRDVDVLSFGYESPCDAPLEIPKIARELRKTLNELLTKNRYESISFVAHSLGGGVVREFILSEHHRLDRMTPLENVILLATPHSGGRLLNFVSYHCPNALRGDPLGLRTFLVTLNDRWKKRFGTGNVSEAGDFSAGFEMVPILSIGKIVDKNSATQFSQTTQGFMKNHPQMARPQGRSDPLYLWVRDQLLESDPDPRVRQVADAEVIRIEEVVRRLQTQLVGTEREPALKFIDDGEIDAALAFLYRLKVGEDPAAKARDHFIKAQFHELNFDSGNALENYKSAVQWAPDDAGYRKETGLYLVILGDYTQAAEYLQETPANYSRALESKHPKIADHWNKLGDEARKLGDNKRAIVYYEKARDSFLTSVGPKHPLLTRIWANLGLVRFRNGDADEAIANWEKAVEGDLRLLGEERPDLAALWNHLGSAWLMKGELDTALGYFEKALERNQKRFGSDHPEVGFGLSQIGDIWRKKGDGDKAIAYYEQAAQSYVAVHGPDHPNLAALWNNLGSVLRAQGDYDRAIQNFEKALRINKKTLGPVHEQVARDLNNLGAALSSKEEYDRAIEYFEKAQAIFQKSGMTRSLKTVTKNLKAARKNKSLLKRNSSSAP